MDRDDGEGSEDCGSGRGTNSNNGGGQGYHRAQAAFTGAAAGEAAQLAARANAIIAKGASLKKGGAADVIADSPPAALLPGAAHLDHSLISSYTTCLLPS